MTVLKQHRKASLELAGRKLTGKFEVSLTNQGDRETLVELINECRKQLREFDPAKAAKRKPTGPAKKKAKAKRLKR
jgi:hypothetical protein